MRSHYEVLGVEPGASLDEIRKAHRRRVRGLHPDSVGEADEDARREEFGRVTAAWAVLSDADRRRAYDERLSEVRPTADVGGGLDGVVGFTSSRFLATIVRVGPAGLILAALGVIFVATAYGVGRGPQPDLEIPPDRRATSVSAPDDGGDLCGLVDAQGGVELVACGVPGSRLVVDIVEPPESCPDGSLGRSDRNLMSQRICLDAE